MNEPLGNTAGNGIEVTESLDVLRGGGPPDLVELTVALAREMLSLVGIDDADPAVALTDGSALARFEALVEAQGGDLSKVPLATDVRTVPAPASGYVQELHARPIGVAAWLLGAGRARKEDAVSATAGVRWLARRGDEVAEGQPLFEVHVDDPSRVAAALDALAGAAVIGAEPPEPRPLVIERIAS